MIPLRQELEALAVRIVAEREQQHECILPHIDRRFLIETIASLMFEMADKFVIGAKEHGSKDGDNEGGTFINDCNHLMELDKEVVDFVMYSRAFRFRQANPQYRK